MALDWGLAGLRAVLDDVRSGRLPDPPSRVRVLVHKGADTLSIGQGVDLTAQLMPPPGPAAPGDSDFARTAFFERIGAVGFVFGAPEIAPLPHAPTLWQRVSGLVESMRMAVTARIRAQLPDSEGAIASAIITGERGGIDPDDEAALRDAGLAHVLAIAGPHMALVGAGLFWLVRAILALIPAIALAYPIKKWAAGLALAAAILLLIRPEAITEPGFQMSFAAVASLVANLATLPFAMFYFGRATHYAVLGNLLALPMMGLVVMPSAALKRDGDAFRS